MPMLEIERVLPDGAPPAAPGLATAVANAAGRALGSPPGHAWVRLRGLAASAYAENASPPLPADALPVFVTLLLAHPPEGDALAAQVRALTDALAGVLGVEAARVHVQVAPAGAGRQAFGGEMVR